MATEEQISELLRLAQMGWCDRRELDAAFRAVGGEVQPVAGGCEERYWHPLMGRPSGPTKSAASRKDAGGELRGYARRTARKLREPAAKPAPTVAAATPPAPTIEAARYKPPPAAPRPDRGAMARAPSDVLIPDVYADLEREARARDKARRSEERSAKREAQRLAQEEERLTRDREARWAREDQEANRREEIEARAAARAWRKQVDDEAMRILDTVNPVKKYFGKIYVGVLVTCPCGCGALVNLKPAGAK